jgi:hypothetical protein
MSFLHLFFICSIFIFLFLLLIIISFCLLGGGTTVTLNDNNLIKNPIVYNVC